MTSDGSRSDRRLPLLAGRAAATPLARRGSESIGCGRFLRDVAHVAAALPDRGHLLNVATDRYRFAVGFAAALVRGQISVLPPSTHAVVQAQLVADFPDLYCLTDGPRSDVDLPQVALADLLDDADFRRTSGDGATFADADVPTLPADRIAAYVFTSGSTGTPTRHVKRWGALVASARAAGRRLFGDAPPPALVATVPPQHMYGLESSLLLAWQAGATLVAKRPFFPADIATALAETPDPTMLVTTPFHLRTLVDDGTRLPPLRAILCATAPLSVELARVAEARYGAPVLEIYGCTEAGQLATRRVVADPVWTLFDGLRLSVRDGVARVSGDAIGATTPIGDRLAIVEGGADEGSRFELVGRSGDLVNIAGKRTSLAHLDVQLLAIDGVVDGGFYLPDDDAIEHDGVTRLGAVVVAPGLTSAQVIERLRERVDAAFLPRPLHRVEHLPRNATGKLTAAALRAAVAGLDRGVAPAPPPLRHPPAVPGTS